MNGPRYVFHTRWFTRDATLEEVSDILSDAARLAEWWPAVYLTVRVVEPGGEHGLGSRVNLFTKGWPPYTLRWQLHVERINYRHGSTVTAVGDLSGRGVWTHRAVDGGVETTYTGETSLQLEVKRRRGESVGSPPQPTFRRR